MRTTLEARLTVAGLRPLTIGAILAVALAAMSVAPVAAAQSVNVGCTAGNGNVAQLDQALRRANRGSADAVTEITLGRTCTYVLSSAANTLAYGATGLPVVTRHVIIDGRHALIERAAGAPPFRILAVGASGNLTLINVRIKQGRTPDGAPGVDNTDVHHASGRSAGSGGGIYNLGLLTLDHVVVRANSTGNGGRGGSGTSADGDPGANPGQNGGDALAAAGGNGGAGGGGGGIYNAGTLIVIDSTISGNTTGVGGAGGSATAGNGGEASAGSPGGQGGAGGDATGGTGGNGGDGAAILDVGTLLMLGSVVDDNTAGGAGTGGQATGGNGGVGGDPNGIGGNGGHALSVGGDGGTASVLVRGTATLDSSTVSNNNGGAHGDGSATAPAGGVGGCDGPGGTGGSWEEDTGSVGGGGIVNSGNLIVTNVTVSGNSSGGPGGAIGGAGSTGASGPPC